MKLHVRAVAKGMPAADAIVGSSVATYHVSCKSFAAGVSTAVFVASTYVTVAAMGVVVPCCTRVKLAVVTVDGSIETSNVADTVVLCGR
jgi:hypothetical protein